LPCDGRNAPLQTAQICPIIKTMKTRIVLVLLVFSLCLVPLAAQEAYDEDEGAGYPPIPRQFRQLALGMSLDDLRTALAGDGLFRFRGERDVSFLPVRQETLVETTGDSFIRRAHFQLTGGEVFIMSFTMDTRLIDHYSLFTTFVNRYGQPVILNPSEAVWEDGYTRVSIERPLTVKYVDRTVFDRLREESRALEAWQNIIREEFLAEF